MMMDAIQAVRIQTKVLQSGTRVCDNMVVFCDSVSPLSWEHETSLIFDQLTFKSIEHIITYLKAQVFQDIKSANRIAATSPKSAKLQKIHRFEINKWKRVEHKAVAVAAMVAVTQNAGMRSELKLTGQKRLVYASRNNTHFSCGLDITSDDVLYPQFWKGSNKYGQILEQLRKTI